MSQGQMQIGEIAERTGLSINTLRHYDQSGLVTPSARSTGGFRLYTESDLERLLVVRRMKPLGFTLDEMGELLAVTDRLMQGSSLPAAEETRLQAALLTFRQAAEDRRDKLAKELGYAEDFLATMDQLGGHARPE